MRKAIAFWSLYLVLFPFWFPIAVVYLSGLLAISLVQALLEEV